MSSARPIEGPNRPEPDPVVVPVNVDAMRSSSAPNDAGAAPTTSREALRTASAYHFFHAVTIVASRARAAAGSAAAAASFPPSDTSIAIRSRPAAATTSATSMAIAGVADAMSHADAPTDTPTLRISSGLVLSGVSKFVW